MNDYRTLTNFEIKEIKKYLKNEKDIYNLQYFIEEILREHYTEGYSDKAREVVDAFNNLINSQMDSRKYIKTKRRNEMVNYIF